MSRPLVSVVTGTWQRHELLMEAIDNVRDQTYRPLEHVIVADGPDSDLRTEIEAARLDQIYGGPTAGPRGERVSMIFQELGFHSSSLFRDSISAAPFMVAQLLAQGEYQVWLADDERFLMPDAIERMVDLLELYEADFVYPQVEMWWADREERVVIGTNPPQCGQFTHCLYRRSALDKGMLFRTHVGSGTDWDACARTMASGARWAFLRDVTLSHRVDK